MAELLLYVAPEFLLILVASALYVAATWVGSWRGWPWCACGCVLLAAVMLAAVGTLAGPESAAEAATVSVAFDRLALSLRWLALATGFAIVLLAIDRARSATAGEYFASLLLLTAGLSLACTANDLILLFASLELISLPTYVLLYLGKRELEAREAAAKYFYLSVLASALFLFGVALSYGLTGATNLRAMHETLLQPELQAAAVPSLGALAVGLILGGVSFKMAAVPFHFYAGDVYQGTTNVMAAALSWFPKVAGAIAALRLLVYALPVLDRQGAWLAWVFAVATMTLGNTMALLQTNVRRLMAFSGVAHAGYMLVALGAGCLQGPPGTLFLGTESLVLYLIAYALMTIGFFAVIIVLSDGERPCETIEDFAGLAQRAPLLAALSTVLLLSLIGLPFTLGFWAKVSVFYAAIATRDVRYVVLAVIGLVNAAIGAFYYLRIVAYIYLRSGYTQPRIRFSSPSFLVAVVCAILTLALGLWPAPAAAVAHASGAWAEGQLEARLPQASPFQPIER